MHNIKAVIVGGYVRDYFLGLDSKDIDIELYGVDSLETVEKILQEFGKVNNVGKSFGVCKLLYKDLDLDFSLPRRDSKMTEGHRGFHITVDADMNFKTAARRRDFTMNAIGYDVITQEILDPYNGLHDLNSKILKAVDLKSFGEDPLRVLRAVSFVARFDLKMEKDLFDLCKSMIEKGVLNELPQERIFNEIKKILLLSTKPSKGFKLLQKLSAFQFFTEFQILTATQLSSLLKALDRGVIYTKELEYNEKLILLLTLLTTKFSKKECINFLGKITHDKKLTQAVISLKETYFELNNINNYSIYKLALKVPIYLFALYLKALYPTQISTIEILQKRAKQLGVLEKKLQPIMGGKDLIALGLQPSKQFSTLLAELYELQMREKIQTKEEARKWLKRTLVVS